MSKPVELTLYQRALVLIAAPLAFGLILSTVLLFLNQFYQQKVQEEVKTQEQIFHANNFYIECTGIISSRLGARIFSDDRGYYQEREQKEDMEADYKVLQTMTNPTEFALVQKIFDAAKRVILYSDAFVVVPGPDHSSLERIQKLKENFEIVKGVVEPLDELSAAFRAFRSQERFVNGETAKEVQEMNALINTTLLSALAISVLLTLLLYFYFMRTIYAGVHALIQNAHRFQSGQKLMPALTGRDEIAQVDVAFHKMATDLEAANKFKQEMLSMVSHDLRTPLTAVTGYLSLVSEGPYGGGASDELRRQAAAHEVELFNVVKLINSVLDSEKIEAGAMELATRSMYVETIVEKAIEQLQPLADAAQVTVAFTPSELEVEADPHRIGQAMTAFLETAINSTPPGKQVNIELRQVETIIKFIVVIPKRINESSLKTIFERYTESRPDDIKVPEDQSLALGSAIVKLHGGDVGTVREESETKIWFSLPLPEATA